MSKLVNEVCAALEAVRTHRGKKVVRICGRSASTLAQVEQAALLEGMTQKDFDLLASSDPSGSNAAPDTFPTSLKGTPQHETIILTPGSAVYRADGMLPAISESFGATPGEGGESAPVWCLPGDFERYLVPGNPEKPTNGIVREVLVGLPRDERDGDLDIADGIFLKPEQWNSVVMPIESALRSLAQQIGIDPESEQLPEQMPRAESWLAERAEADAKLAAASELVGVLEGKLAVAIEAASLPRVPENALELIQQASGLSKPKAGAVLAALTTPPSEQE